VTLLDQTRHGRCPSCHVVYAWGAAALSVRAAECPSCEEPLRIVRGRVGKTVEVDPEYLRRKTAPESDAPSHSAGECTPQRDSGDGTRIALYPDMKTSINGKLAGWPAEIWAEWKNRVLLNEKETIESANYFTIRPRVDEYNRADPHVGFTYILNPGRHVCYVQWVPL
jgi:hypothetical protein